jgi:hypothetical protein
MVTRYITREWKVEGVLTDPTSVVLRDAANLYGIKRNDTGVSVVASGTALTKLSTGIYRYDFEQPVDGIAYTAQVEVVYDGKTYRFEEDLPATSDATDMTVSYSGLLSIIGRKFFGKRTGFLENETDDINDIIKSGLQAVYRAHYWSFLRPTKDIVTEADESTYDLPAGFDGIDDSKLTWPENEGYCAPVPIVPWSDIRRLRSVDERTGRPELAAIIAAEFDATAGSKRQIVFFPTPDDEYTLSAVMRLRWTMLDESNPYPIGGEILAEAITEACLASGERLIDGAPGVHAEAFQAALEAAIWQDKDATSPATLGQDGGPIDLGGRRLNRAWNMGDVSFDGEAV